MGMAFMEDGTADPGMAESVTHHGKYMRLLVLAGLVVVLDQITKAAIWEYVPLYHSINVIPGFFDVTHVHNPGGAFGILAESSKGLRQFFFLAVTSVAVVMIFLFYRTIPPSHPWLLFGLALIFGGALGNLIDRVRLGKVVDFLKFYIGQYQWPSFNVADSAVTIGVGIFILHMVFGKMPDNWR